MNPVLTIEFFQNFTHLGPKTCSLWELEGEEGVVFFKLGEVDLLFGVDSEIFCLDPLAHPQKRLTDRIATTIKHFLTISNLQWILINSGLWYFEDLTLWPL
jgi:hypothetical protein